MNFQEVSLPCRSCATGHKWPILGEDDWPTLAASPWPILAVNAWPIIAREMTQNAYIERFNRTYREAVLDAYLFRTVEEVQALTEDWLEEYNAVRPHAALGNVPPYQFAPKQP